mmetsp:Transcript_46580/g.137642  ORF Transcript_46580/g.137642 Transcript_46580/m.137642 type:complete len:251 (-) Transcript_46580:152-904(-)
MPGQCRGLRRLEMERTLRRRRNGRGGRGIAEEGVAKPHVTSSIVPSDNPRLRHRGGAPELRPLACHLELRPLRAPTENHGAKSAAPPCASRRGAAPTPEERLPLWLRPGSAPGRPASPPAAAAAPRARPWPGPGGWRPAPSRAARPPRGTSGPPSGSASRSRPPPDGWPRWRRPGPACSPGAGCGRRGAAARRRPRPPRARRGARRGGPRWRRRRPRRGPWRGSRPEPAAGAPSGPSTRRQPTARERPAR